MIRAVTALLLVGAGFVSPEIRHFRYERPVTPAATKAGQSCAAIPAEVFPHASVGLDDLRLYQGATEVPFVLTTLQPTKAHPGSLPPRNLGVQQGRTVFDAAMPTGTYNEVDLDLSAQNFIATASVWGSQAQSNSKLTKLGDFTIFDLTGQRLGRSTVLHLPDADFRFLHFAITGHIRPDQVQGIALPAQAAGKTAYTTVASNSQVIGKNRSSVVEFTLPPHVPVDRVVFAPGTEPPAFSREVSLTVRPVAERTPDTEENAPPPPPSVFNGSLLRLHRMQDGQQIDEERLSIDLSTPSFDTPTHWTVTVENGDDPPLDLGAVRLEFEERSLCFNAAQGARYTLLYGDDAIAAPQYDYARFFVPQPDATRLILGPEQPNPTFTARPDQRPFTERHPALLWIALLAAIGLLGTVALRSGVKPKLAP